MVEIYVNDPVIAGAAVSPLKKSDEQINEQGTDNRVGVELSERFGVAICEMTCWPKMEKKAIAAVEKSVALSLTNKPNAGTVSERVQAFQHGPGRWTLIGTDPAMPDNLHKAIGDAATMVDLTHGRTVFRINGDQSRWVLSKLFAIDFADKSFGITDGLATKHHEFLTQIQRVDEQTFDLIVFRSLARAFWHSLQRASADIGYRIG